MMLAAPFSSGVGIYTFYAMQPFLLELYGDPHAYTVAGLAAAIVAGSQIVGGYAAPRIRRLFRKRTSALILGTLASAVILALLGLDRLLLARAAPPRRLGADLRRRDADPTGVPQRHDPVAAAGHGALLRLADGDRAAASSSSRLSARPPTPTSYGTSFLFASLIQLAALPFIVRSRRERAPADTAIAGLDPVPPPPRPADSPA